MNKGPIYKKSFQFALDIISIFNKLQSEREYILSKQLLRSATSIGANVNEASAAISKKDFTHKMSISSKEARETLYWLLLLQQSDLVKLELQQEIKKCEELIRILTAIVKTSQSSL